MKLYSLVIFSFFTNFALGQVPANGTIIFAKEFSKEISLYRAKTFVIQEILADTIGIVKFEIDPLAAATSGELTTLVYKCESKKKSGLILGFFGNRWNDAGVNYQAYSFKNLSIIQANELINKIENAVSENSKYLNEDLDNNNIYFVYEDLKILIYGVAYGYKIRVYWNNFDSEWNFSEFKKTQKRLAKKMK